MAILWGEKREEQMLARMLGELGFGHLWQPSGATIHFDLDKAKHQVSVYRIAKDMHLWGLSHLVFKPGCVPPGVTRGVMRRNTQLDEIQWTHSLSWDHEIFAVSVAKPIRQLNALDLRTLLMRTVEELERCRRILDFVRN